MTILFGSDTDATKIYPDVTVSDIDTDATKLDSDVIILEDKDTTIQESDTTPLLFRPVKRRRQTNSTCRKRLLLRTHTLHYCTDEASTESIDTPPRNR